jgi:hypothetical protein
VSLRLWKRGRKRRSDRCLNGRILFATEAVVLQSENFSLCCIRLFYYILSLLLLLEIHGSLKAGFSDCCRIPPNINRPCNNLAAFLNVRISKVYHLLVLSIRVPFEANCEFLNQRTNLANNITCDFHC